jgi:ATP-dependent DNA ligase
MREAIPAPSRARVPLAMMPQKGAGAFSRIEPTLLAVDTASMAMSIKGLPAGFIFPAQPVLRLKPPAGTDWVHEIKHDGYRMIVHRDGPTVRLYSRNACDWTGDWRRSRLLPS